MITLEVSPEEEERIRQAAARRVRRSVTIVLGLASRDYSQAAATAGGRTFLGGSPQRLHRPLPQSETPSDTARNSEEEFGKIMDEKKRLGHV